MKSTSGCLTIFPAMAALLAGCGITASSSSGSFSEGACIASPASNGTGYQPPSNAASLSKEVPRPGPDILYWPLATAPQLENTGIWKAAPIMVSGASVYRNGEFVYQDFIYDDLGAASSAPTPDPLYVAFATKQGGWGTYKYPADPDYANNAADILEVRVRQAADATALRITYNSMINPELVASTIALGDSAEAMPMPHGANAKAPAKVFVTAHGCNGDFVDAASGKVVEGQAPGIQIDVERHQVEVRVPFSVFDPRGQHSVRLTVASGLWDAANGSYLAPAGSATSGVVPNGPTATLPAVGTPNSAAFFNVAFRSTEPIPVNVGAAESPGNPPPQNQWMEYQQSQVLASGDLTPLHADIDFTKLASGANDDMLGQPGGIPQSGFFNRIHVSHFEDAQGRGNDTSNPVPCDPPECTHYLAGRLQPYSVYVPARLPPPAGYGLTVEPHGAGDNYSNGAGRNPRRQIAERGAVGTISITMTGRNTAGWYLGESGAEVFEVWADVAAHYPLDPTFTVIEGGSMAGYASYKLAGQFPDLFAKSGPYIPCPSAGTFWAAPGTAAPGGDERVTQPLLPNFRNVPLFVRAGAFDPICAYWRQQEDRGVLDALGYRYKFWTLTDSHGLPFYIKYFNDQVLADWLGDTRLDPNPPHVTYVLDGGLNEPRYGLNADHAYWVSGLKLRDGSGTLPLGKVDVRSHGFGVGDAPALATQENGGVITGGEVFPVIPYVSQEKEWGAAPSEPVENKLDITAENIVEMTIQVDRARVGCDAQLNVQTDGPIEIHLAGCSITRSFN